jgi:DNA processing protein
LVETYGGAKPALEKGRACWEALRRLPAGECPAREGRKLRLPRGVGGPRSGEELLAAAERAGYAVLTYGEEEYPALLGQAVAPPPVLYVRGTLVRDDWRALAVVGTRRASGYGRFHADRLAAELAAEGFTVVSGLARGIDEAAHRGALRAGGRTLAVLGCGPDRLYPPENAALAAEITEHGALLTEFPPGTPPLPENFLWRNRVIAGLALGTVVVEAGERSGAINTAFHANDAGRQVFAVPGEPGRPGTAGCHLLLRLGARLLERGSQARDDLAPWLEPGLWFGPVWQRGPIAGADRWAESRLGRTGSGEGGQLWEALLASPGGVEELAARARWPVGRVAAQLVLWELEGRIRRYPDGRAAAAKP